uniref:Uncharacterized protein n=1 Tax=Anguilla anguilla TaxID=7936 RepID=A0A0E9VLF8_ANGAN
MRLRLCHSFVKPFPIGLFITLNRVCALYLCYV